MNTDQHTWDAISAYGNSYLNTPNIDRLHQNGISFMRSYCTDPVCAPARSSWATGLYATETGVPFNGGHLHDHIPDLGQVLNAGGYNAYHCGKWHVDGRNVRESFKTLYFGQRAIGACGGRYYDPASTHAAIDLLTSYEEKKPFYLQIGYVNPHDICEYEHNHEEKIIPGPVEQGIVREEELPPLPVNFHYDSRETAILQVCRRIDNALIHSRILRAVKQWSEPQWRYLTWNLYRFIEKVDGEIGMVLDALEQTRFRDNTLVIFSVDHGEAHGRHQMFQKFTLYEESIHVPFIVASFSDQLDVPEGQSDHEHLISGVDMFPTVCDYAGIDVSDDLQGASVRPLVEGRETEWRDFAYVESNYWGRAIVTERYKFMTEYMPKGEEDFVPPGPDPDSFGLMQLYDLEEDPWETRNLALNEEHSWVIEDCREKLLDQEKRLKRLPVANQQRILAWSEELKRFWEDR
jgi:arylsulfatase A-like enzyme